MSRVPAELIRVAVTTGTSLPLGKEALLRVYGERRRLTGMIMMMLLVRVIQYRHARWIPGLRR